MYRNYLCNTERDWENRTQYYTENPLYEAT